MVFWGVGDRFPVARQECHMAALPMRHNPPLLFGDVKMGLLEELAERNESPTDFGSYPLQMI